MNFQLDSSALLDNSYNSTWDLGMFTMDLDGRITTWNAGAERIIGFSREEIIGQDNAVIFTPEDRDKGLPSENGAL